MTKVFIDGSAGTTGLNIHDRLAKRTDIELITLPEDLRKDTSARADALNSADIAFLCLPDEAAKQAVELVENPKTVIIDTSTAHRTSEGWTYGFPELRGQREKVKKAKRIANPGCHASGFIALVAPLVEKRVISRKAVLSCFSITGYSGGGKKMIAQYEAFDRDPLLEAPRLYGLEEKHKHVPEMMKYTGLENTPAFCPIACDFYSGMETIITITRAQTSTTAKEIEELYQKYYPKKMVHFSRRASEDGFVSAAKYSGRDDMEITVQGSDDRIILISRFDNLGKGACGAAIQNMNLVLGLDESYGLILKNKDDDEEAL